MTIVVILGSCRSSKNIPSGPVPVRSKIEILDAIKNHNIEYDWFAAYGKIKFDSEEIDAGSKVYLRMKKDSIIWMTFKKLNITAAQLLITPDSFFVIHRLDKAYEKGSLDLLKHSYNLPMEFAEMQDYFAGNIPYYADTTSVMNLSNNNYSIKSQKDHIHLETLVDAYSLQVNKVIATDQNKNEVIVNFDKYNEHEELPMLAFKRNFLINFDKGNGLQTSKMNFDFSEISINQFVKTPFNIPRHYENIGTN